jgi:hypothetical protein
VRPDGWQLSEGEIHFHYWFIQGSIMIPETRCRLRRAWGLCERHAWGSIGGGRARDLLADVLGALGQAVVEPARRLQHLARAREDLARHEERDEGLG